MTIQLFSNNAKTTLASAITNTQTTISVAPGTGSIFPNPSAGQAFKVTLNSATTTTLYEICLCTSRSGDTLTVVRGQEGTTASAFSLGDFAGNFDTAGVMADLVQSEQLQQNYYTYADASGTANAITATIPSNLTALSDGMMVIINAAAANTGAVTFNLTMGSTVTGVLPVVLSGNIALVAGQIPGAGTQLLLIYSSSYSAWVLANPSIVLTSYAPINSPTFTGTPAAPTPATADNSTKIATTAYVQANLANYAPIYAPTFTGIPAAPTASAGTNTTQLATTAFVTTAVNGLAPINSPALTGTPTTPTPASGDNSFKIASTAFIQNAITGLFSNVTFPARALNTNYTNNTGKPMLVTVSLNDSGGYYTPSFLINGSIVQSWIANSYSGGSPYCVIFSCIVPSGATYQMKNTSGVPSITQWTEIY
jgi:hypothetical protein